MESNTYNRRYNFSVKKFNKLIKLHHRILHNVMLYFSRKDRVETIKDADLF